MVDAGDAAAGEPLQPEVGLFASVVDHPLHVRESRVGRRRLDLPGRSRSTVEVLGGDHDVDMRVLVARVVEVALEAHRDLRERCQVNIVPSDVQISFLQPVDASAAFKTGAIDAWATWDPYTAIAQIDNGATILRDNAGLSPGLSFLDANSDALKDADKRAAITDFVARYVISLARRRVDVIYAMLRDHQPYRAPQPPAEPHAA